MGVGGVVFVASGVALAVVWVPGRPSAAAAAGGLDGAGRASRGGAVVEVGCGCPVREFGAVPTFGDAAPPAVVDAAAPLVVAVVVVVGDAVPLVAVGAVVGRADSATGCVLEFAGGVPAAVVVVVVVVGVAAAVSCSAVRVGAWVVGVVAVGVGVLAVP
jgi:hypothetical protein